jgi:hypothetical protein
MANETMMRNLIQGIQQKDPRLYDALNQIITNLQKLNKNVDELTAEDLTPELIDTFVPDVTNFIIHTQPTFLELWWEAPDNEVIGYEIRKGIDWDTADFILTTGSINAQLSPIVSGTHTYLIKALGSGGTESFNATSATITVSNPGSLTITSRVVDNNVLLTWTEPLSTFQIKHYKIEKGATLIGYREGTFTVIFEQVAGTYTYVITAYDIAGNVGPANSISAIVNQPPDYVLRSEISDDFSGTKVNVTATDVPTLMCNVEDETWEEHFTTRGWTSPQDQIDAGFPYYLQPTPLTGTYTAHIDYGVIISSIIVNIDWAFQLIAGSGHNITCRIRVSDDNTTWSSWTTSTSLFVASLRYLEVELTFTALD